ncbi:hypothetical protein B0T17DRAFT_495026 [Bombardia bombarda]|uniref:Carboxymethylenebutenolidase n=1 Tax=Bombardia bombarda TaxID=252184 RepID=A0AA40C235_9PEZI|nr:hypothetical protein B0T17DRAFT_495026 [Bombardia bombarda]
MPARIQLTPHCSIQPPLSRRGRGPPMIIFVPDHLDLSLNDQTVLDPPPLQKWAEESYCVGQVLVGKHDDQDTIETKIAMVRNHLSRHASSEEHDMIGIVISDAATTAAIEAIEAFSLDIVTLVFFGCYPPQPIVGSRGDTPVLVHLPRDYEANPNNPKVISRGRNEQYSIIVYRYLHPGSFFTISSHKDYGRSAASLAHSRTLEFLKSKHDGPHFDLAQIWDEHTSLEFGPDKSVEATMATMVQEPYVNHVPTLTGGIGRERLTSFYREHFIHSNSEDATLELVSRTVGIDRVVDEFIFKCTHNKVIDWLVPGVPPTYLYIRIPMTAIVGFRGDRLCHEHISWDQGTVLRQLGLMPEYLPFPYIFNGRAEGKTYEYRVPVAGTETARKLADAKAEPSNGMLEFAVREAMDGERGDGW